MGGDGLNLPQFGPCRPRDTEEQKCGIFCPVQCGIGDPGAVTLWWEVKAPLWVGAPWGQQEAHQCSRLSDSQGGRRGLPGNATLGAASYSGLGDP